MAPWNDETNVANELIRLVKFYFETSNGPGYISAVVGKGVPISNAKTQFMAQLSEAYKSVEITKYEILEMADDYDDLKFDDGDKYF